MARWLLLFSSFLALPQAWAQNSVDRIAPALVSPEVWFSVSNVVTVAPGISVYAVEERPPGGWSVGQISHFGMVDAANGKIKWGPFFDNSPRTLTYKLKAPAGASGLGLLTGDCSFDGRPGTISGRAQIEIEPGSAEGETDAVVTEAPPTYAPGRLLTVTNRVRLSTNTIVYSIEQNVPTNWMVSALTHGGVLDRLTGKLKWGPFSDRVARVFTFNLTPPLGAREEARFDGVGSFDGKLVPITGAIDCQPLLSTLTATLPDRFQPGSPIVVMIECKPSLETRVYAVEDQPPNGWLVSEMSHGGSWDAESKLIKWGPFFDNAPRTLSYAVQPPLQAQAGLFTGQGSFDGTTAPVGGQRETMNLTSTVVRKLPPGYLPGVSLVVSNIVTPLSFVGVQAVEESPPPSWIIDDISHGGQLDAVSGKIKWGPFLDPLPRILTYRLTPPIGASESGAFLGTGSFDANAVAIAGDSELIPELTSNANQVVRSLPSSLRVGRSLLVTNSVRPAANISVQAVEEEIPNGWAVTELSDGGQFDGTTHKIKWGPFFDHAARELRYRVTPPVGASGSVVFNGAGSFDGLAVPIIGAQTLLALPNAVPVARDDALTSETIQTLVLPVSKLLNNDSDPNQDSLQIATGSKATARGGVATFTSETLTYVPPENLNSEDWFNYTIQDGYGGSATAKVTVVVAALGPGQNITIALTNGWTRLICGGIPDRSYVIQASVDLSAASWTSLSTNRAPRTGRFEFTDSETVAPARFYRTIAIP